MASNDPDFEKKAADIIGLYLNPPQQAAVSCIDEKSAIQALDRLLPVLPLSPGRAERHGFAVPPAQMHEDEQDRHKEDRDKEEKDRRKDEKRRHTNDGVEWFVSTDGGDGGGSTIRVTKMTDHLSDSPNFTYTSLPVTEYRYAGRADQPGGDITTFPNTTTTQVHFHKGHLVTAMASSTASDGFVHPKGLIYQIDDRVTRRSCSTSA
jgi:hypothetical protein